MTGGDPTHEDGSGRPVPDLTDSRLSPLTDASPRRVGQYRTLARLGTGGMAEVYLAVDRGPIHNFNKLVVLKFIRAALRQDASTRQMFLDEARIAARMSHPNVVHTYSVGAEGERFAIVMEYLEGVSLAELMQRTRDQPLSARLPLLGALADALRGLDYVHEFADYGDTPLDLVHRDVKPANVFVTFGGQVKILDFGVAEGGTGDDSSSGGAFKGTVRYAAPEAVGDDAHVDRRVDLFAAGIILWELLAGRRLWDGFESNEILSCLKKGWIPELPDAGIPAPLVAVVERALSADPDKRYASAGEFRTALLEALDAAGSRIGPDTVVATVRHLLADERAARARAVRVLLDRLDDQDALAVEDPTVVELDRNRSSDPPPRRLMRPAALVVAGLAVAGVLAWFAMPGATSSPSTAEAPAHDDAARAAAAPEIKIQPPAAAQPPPPPEPEEPPTPPVDTVRVWIQVAPTSAKLTVDGNEVTGNPYAYEGPADGAAVEVIAEAEGYETSKTTLHPKDDAFERIVLKPLPKRGRTRTKAPEAKQRDKKLTIDHDNPYAK